MTNGTGVPEQWRGELDNRSELAEIGVRASTFQPGDRIVVKWKRQPHAATESVRPQAIDRAADGFWHEQVGQESEDSRPRVKRAIVISLLGLTIAAADVRLTTVAAQSKVPDLHGYWTNATFTPSRTSAGARRARNSSPRPKRSGGAQKRLDRYRAQPKNDVHLRRRDLAGRDLRPRAEPAHVLDNRPAQRESAPLTAEAAKAIGSPAPDYRRRVRPMAPRAARWPNDAFPGATSGRR